MELAKSATAILAALTFGSVDLAPPAQIAPEASGVYSVSMKELDRIELPVGAETGYLLMNDQRRLLPIGSTLKNGVFYWQPGPGFLGEYELLFDRPDAARCVCGS